jgi:hypothetical protein
MYPSIYLFTVDRDRARCVNAHSDLRALCECLPVATRPRTKYHHYVIAKVQCVADHQPGAVTLAVLIKSERPQHYIVVVYDRRSDGCCKHYRQISFSLGFQRQTHCVTYTNALADAAAQDQHVAPFVRDAAHDGVREFLIREKPVGASTTRRTSRKGRAPDNRTQGFSTRTVIGPIDTRSLIRIAAT